MVEARLCEPRLAPPDTGGTRQACHEVRSMDMGVPVPEQEMAYPGPARVDLQDNHGRTAGPRHVCGEVVPRAHFPTHPPIPPLAACYLIRGFILNNQRHVGTLTRAESRRASTSRAADRLAEFGYAARLSARPGPTIQGDTYGSPCSVRPCVGADLLMREAGMPQCSFVP